MKQENAPIRRILVPLDPSKYTQTAIACACEIAMGNDALVEGMTVLDIPGIRREVTSFNDYNVEFRDELKKSKTHHAQTKIEDLLREFKKTCERAQVSYARSEYQGYPGDKILDAAMYHDLIVMGLRTFFHFETQDEPGDSLVRVLNHTVTPILAVPQQFHWPLRKVLIAFDGSFPAARTLHYFIGFAQGKDFEITLLNVDKDQTEGTFYLDRAEKLFNAHRVDVASKEWRKGKVIDVIDPSFYDEADLIVAGIHAKKDIKKFFVGSLMKHLIKKNQKPLFLAQ